MDDVDRALPDTTDIAYGGTIIARLAAGQVATLTCARKRMRGNVTIVAGSGGGGGNSSVITDGASVFILSATVTREGDNTLIIA